MVFLDNVAGCFGSCAGWCSNKTIHSLRTVEEFGTLSIIRLWLVQESAEIRHIQAAILRSVKSDSSSCPALFDERLAGRYERCPKTGRPIAERDQTLLGATAEIQSLGLSDSYR